MNIYEALAKFLRARDLDVEKVTDFDEYTNSYGGCETCSWDETEVTIYYHDSEGFGKSYTYSGKMVDLVRELTD